MVTEEASETGEAGEETGEGGEETGGALEGGGGAGEGSVATACYSVWHLLFCTRELISWIPELMNLYFQISDLSARRL